MPVLQAMHALGTGRPWHGVRCAAGPQLVAGCAGQSHGRVQPGLPFADPGCLRRCESWAGAGASCFEFLPGNYVCLWNPQPFAAGRGGASRIVFQARADGRGAQIERFASVRSGVRPCGLPQGCAEPGWHGGLGRAGGLAPLGRGYVARQGRNWWPGAPVSPMGACNLGCPSRIVGACGAVRAGRAPVLRASSSCRETAFPSGTRSPSRLAVASTLRAC